MHRETEREREREREMQQDRRATSGTEVLGVMHSYIIDAISSLERLARVYEKLSITSRGARYILSQYDGAFARD